MFSITLRLHNGNVYAIRYVLWLGTVNTCNKKTLLSKDKDKLKISWTVCVCVCVCVRACVRVCVCVHACM